MNSHDNEHENDLHNDHDNEELGMSSVSSPRLEGEDTPSMFNPPDDNDDNDAETD